MPLCTLVLVFAIAIPQSARSAQPSIVIKFSHVVDPDTPKGKAADLFKRLVEKRSAQRVVVEVFANSSLYKDNEELEALQLGAVQMLAPSLAKFGPLGIKEFEVFNLPFLFADRAALRRAEEGELGRSVFAALEQRGLKGLAFWDNGFKVMSANKPLREPEDFRGLKMRIQGSKVIDAQFRALGAKPLVMSLSEVYAALKSGLVDGTENPPSNLYTQKMYEVQSHVTVSNHGYLGYAVIVNKRFWDGLPADIRTMLETALAEATEYEYAIAQKENDDALDEIRKSRKTRIHVLTEDQKRRWRSALSVVYREVAPQLGRVPAQLLHPAE